MKFWVQRSLKVEGGPNDLTCNDKLGLTILYRMVSSRTR